MGGLPGMCVPMIVLIVIQFITGISTELVIYREGCIASTSPFLTGVTGTASANLTNNYPGTCLAYCQRQGIRVKYIALKATSCLCGPQRQYPDSGKYINSTRACNVTCPGHTDHLCGGQNDYSLCIIESDSTIQDTSQCLSYQCGARIGIEATDCSTDLSPLCAWRSTLEPKCDLAKDHWSQALRQCSDGLSFEDRYDYLKHKTRFCHDLSKISSFSPCKTNHSWIGAFAAWAPPKSCNNRSLTIDHGSYTVRYNASGDMETIDYSCNDGHPPQGAVTWFCMANNSWVSAPWSPDKPACNKTSTPSTSSPATAATSRPTAPTAAPVTNPSTTIVVSGTSTIGSDKDDTGMSAGVIAAIVIGACIAVALTSTAICCVIMKYIVGGKRVGHDDDDRQDAVSIIPRETATDHLPDVSTT